MDYYGLDDLFGGGGYMDNEIPLDDSERKIVQFKDSKLQNMWKKAEEAGFSGTFFFILFCGEVIYDIVCVNPFIVTFSFSFHRYFFFH